MWILAMLGVVLVIIGFLIGWFGGIFNFDRSLSFRQQIRQKPFKVALLGMGIVAVGCILVLAVNSNYV